MTVSELTDLQISLWIAEKLEPEASLPEYFDIEPGEWSYSPLKCWRTLLGEWEPRPMVNDPAMTVMLKVRLVEMGYDVEILWRREKDVRIILSRKGDAVRQLQDGIEPRVVWGYVEGRAVAEAFMLANGYTG